MPSIKFKAIITLFRLFRIKAMLRKRGNALEAMFRKIEKQNLRRVPRRRIQKYADDVIRVQDRPVYLFRSLRHSGELGREQQSGCAPKGAVLYLFGGGFMMSATKGDFLWARQLADRAGVDVYLPEYPLTPKHSIEDTILFIDEVYREILSSWKPDQVKFLGFSSGASLIPFYFAYLSRKGITDSFPKKVYLSSPAWEIPPTDETYQAMKRRDAADPIIPADLFVHLQPYLIKKPEYAYLTRPEETSFEHICPVYLTYGERESMSAYRGIAERMAKRDGFELEVHIGEKMIHCWQFLTMTREGKCGQDDLIHRIATE